MVQFNRSILSPQRCLPWSFQSSRLYTNDDVLHIYLEFECNCWDFRFLHFCSVVTNILLYNSVAWQFYDSYFGWPAWQSSNLQSPVLSTPPSRLKDKGVRRVGKCSPSEHLFYKLKDFSFSLEHFLNRCQILKNCFAIIGNFPLPFIFCFIKFNKLKIMMKRKVGFNPCSEKFPLLSGPSLPFYYLLKYL